MPSLSEYELARLERIKRNQAQLDALGITAQKEDLATQMRKPHTQNIAKKKKKRAAEVDSSTPARQSSRLRGEAAKFYGDLGDDMFDDLMAQEERENYKEFLKSSITNRRDLYNLDQLVGLRSAEVPYTEHPDFIDATFANAKNGTRKEKCSGTLPCHWHRHNVLEPMARCSAGDDCAAMSSKFGGSFWCGPCLHSRYGENVFEILGLEKASDYKAPPTTATTDRNFRHEDGGAFNAWATEHQQSHPEWLCPACRKICNCSTSRCCRDIWGWGTTGVLPAKSQGYDSAAHLLVMGRSYDEVVTSLESAVVQGDTTSIERQLCKAEYLLQGNVTTEQLQKIRQRHNAFATDGTDCFMNGASADQVVAKLRGLVKEGKEKVDAAEVHRAATLQAAGITNYEVASPATKKPAKDGGNFVGEERQASETTEKENQGEPASAGRKRIPPSASVRRSKLTATVQRHHRRREIPRVSSKRGSASTGPSRTRGGTRVWSKATVLRVTRCCTLPRVARRGLEHGRSTTSTKSSINL